MRLLPLLLLVSCVTPTYRPIEVAESCEEQCVLEAGYCRRHAEGEAIGGGLVSSSRVAERTAQGTQVCSAERDDCLVVCAARAKAAEKPAAPAPAGKVTEATHEL